MSATLTIADRVRHIVAEHFVMPLDRVADAVDLRSAMSADSLDLIELQIELDQTFDIEIGDEAVDDWKTVGDLIKAVEALRQ